MLSPISEKLKYKILKEIELNYRNIEEPKINNMKLSLTASSQVKKLLQEGRFDVIISSASKSLDIRLDKVKTIQDLIMYRYDYLSENNKLENSNYENPNIIINTYINYILERFLNKFNFVFIDYNEEDKKMCTMILSNGEIKTEISTFNILNNSKIERNSLAERAIRKVKSAYGTNTIIVTMNKGFIEEKVNELIFGRNEITNKFFIHSNNVNVLDLSELFWILNINFKEIFDNQLNTSYQKNLDDIYNLTLSILGISRDVTNDSLFDILFKDNKRVWVNKVNYLNSNPVEFNKIEYIGSKTNIPKDFIIFKTVLSKLNCKILEDIHPTD